MKYLVESRSLIDATLEPLQLYFNIRDNALGKQWQEVLIKNFFSKDSLMPEDHPVDKLESHWGIPKHPRSIAVMCDAINLGIKIINEEIRPKGYPRIDLDFSVSLLETNAFRDLMNEAHFHFETLVGQKWDVGKWFNNASERGKWAIMELNTNIHQIESYFDGMFEDEQGELYFDDWELRWKDWPLYNGGTETPDIKDAIMLAVSYNCMDFLTKTHPRHNQFKELEKNSISYDSYKCYYEGLPWGSVTLNYAQTGKPYFDAFKDQDKVVSRENITGCRYITGETFIHFVLNTDKTAVEDAYRKWIVENNFDLNDITQGYWPLIVADIDRQSIIPKYGTTDEEVHAMLLKYHDITNVALCDDDYNIIMARDYSWYTWKDQYNAMKAMFK